MKKLRYDPKSIRSGLTLVTLLCWILPIIIIVTMFSVLVNYYNDRNLEQAMELGMENAMHQVELRLLSVIEDSKAVSYDGIVRQSYSEASGLVYKDVTEYLTQKFTRNANYRCVFISSASGDEPVHAYAAAPGTAKLNLLRYYRDSVYPEVRTLLESVDTGIYFLTVDEEIYMVRNLLDHDFTPYAMLVLGLEKSEVFQSLYGNANVSITGVRIDGVELPVAAAEEHTSGGGRQYQLDCDGHTLLLTAQSTALRPLSTMPMLRWAIAGIALLGIPLILLIALIFNRSVNRPMEILLDANRRVENGERGYVITAEAPNTEFRQLYSRFNAMSSELKSQFERLYLEQQALQQAKIRALQSQINPHFLNNTLEIINWEARLADNERVCSMIEALSTMLDAAIGRDGRSEITLSEELKYVDAYLHITKERLGDRLEVHLEIDPRLLDVIIPRLMLQPIVENAVEHDLSRRGGELCLRAYAAEDGLYFEAEHDGSVSEEGWARIREALDAGAAAEPAPAGGSVGMRNVSQRLRLLYGERYRFTVFEPRAGRVMARIVLPHGDEAAAGQKTQRQTITAKHRQKRANAALPKAEEIGYNKMERRPGARDRRAAADCEEKMI